MNFAGRLFRSTDGASAAEFALVLPLLLLLLFGIIDAGRFMWDYNRAEKATQMGVRYAVVTTSVLTGLDDSYSFAVDGGLTSGSAVPNTEFAAATCDSATCTCTPNGADFCAETSRNGTAFSGLVDHMSTMYPPINESNVQIDYKNVGLGFAGNPDGSDVSPLVTVRLVGLSFHPIICLMFACSISMPDFSASLTGEDLNGSASN